MVTVLCLKTANASNTVRCLWSEEGSILEREQSASTAGRESQEVQIASSAPLALCGRTTRPREGSEKRRNPGSPCNVVRMGKRKTLSPSSPQWGENTLSWSFYSSIRDMMEEILPPLSPHWGEKSNRVRRARSSYRGTHLFVTCQTGLLYSRRYLISKKSVRVIQGSLPAVESNSKHARSLFYRG